MGFDLIEFFQGSWIFLFLNQTLEALELFALVQVYSLALHIFWASFFRRHLRHRCERRNAVFLSGAALILVECCACCLGNNIKVLRSFAVFTQILWTGSLRAWSVRLPPLHVVPPRPDNLLYCSGDVFFNLWQACSCKARTNYCRP